MTKKLSRLFIAAMLSLCLFAAGLCFIAPAPAKAAEGDETPTVGAEAYYSETADGQKTKLGEYDNFRYAIDAVVDYYDEDAAHKDYYYTVEVLSDCTIVKNADTTYKTGNRGGYDVGSNEQNAGILIYGDMDITVNGNRHQVVTEGFLRGIRARGESHIVINDLELVTCYGGEAKAFELRGGNMDIELNRTIVQVNAKGNSQALCFGGSGYIVNDDDEWEIATVKCVAKDCSFGTPVPGTIINGKEVKNYFDKDDDGVADTSWGIPTAHYGVMVFVKVDLTLDHSTSGGYAALYLKGGSSSTGSRNSVINLINGSYLRGYNSSSGAWNGFAAVVFEGAYGSQYTYFDYDNDGIVDYSLMGASRFLEDSDITIQEAYDSSSNITVNVVDSTVEATTVNKEPAHQYCFQVRTLGNTISVSGDSVITTDDKYRNNPTKAVDEYYYGYNDITISGGSLYKWDELPAAYIKCDAAIGDKLFSEFADAMASAQDGDTVSLVRSTTVDSGSKVDGADYSAVAQVADGKNITVDLMGKTITVDSSDAALVLIVNAGELTLTNGTIERVHGSAPCNMIVNRGAMTLSDLYVIDRTTIKSATLISNYGTAARSASSALTVTSGTYVSVGGNVVENGVGATVTVNGGTLESRSAAALVNDGAVNIAGGALKGVNALVLNKTAGASAEINGGVLSGGIVADGIEKAGLVVRGGVFDATLKDMVLEHLDAYYQLLDMGSTVSVARFVARDGLVYTGKTYQGVGINELLSDESVQISSDMTVSIIGYTDPDGVEADELPTAIKDAGTYTLEATLSDSGKATFDITIARKTVSLQDLDFTVVKLGDTASKLELASMTIYKTDDNNYEFYATADCAERIDVVAGVVRYRDSAIELGLTVGVDGDAYTVELADNTATAVGKYTTVATLTVKPNYLLSIGDERALAARGLKITENDGVYTVEKTWYVAEAGGWFVDGDNNEYTVASGHTFGQAPLITMPWMSGVDMSNPDVIFDYDDPITLTLTYNGQIVAESFRRYQLATYINDSMPVGEYVLTLTGNVLNGNLDVVGVITASYRYEVYPATVGSALTAFLTELKGSAFTMEWDGYMHVFDEATQVKLRALQQAIADATPERKGVWLDNKYDYLFGGLTVSFNLDRMHNAQYYEESVLAGLADRPAAPGQYVIYYMLSAKNFESFNGFDAQDEQFDALRRKLVYTVVIVRGVDIPAGSSAVYTGSTQKADITGSEFFTVDAYDGFVDKGSHSVTLRLRTPEYYYWKGHELGEETVEVIFEITKASNDWIEAPDVVRWIEGKYNEEENGFIGAAKFGTITYIITDTNDNVLYDAANGINKLGSAKAGTYILKATVEGTENYSGLSEAFTIRILEKIGLPWWATLCITVGALLLAALIIFILWKKGVFQILTEKIVVAIRTKASVDATIASVRAAKRMEEGRQSVAEAKRRERIEALQKRAKELRELPPEERAAQLEAKAQAEAEKAEKSRLRSEQMQARANRLRNAGGQQSEVEPEVEEAEIEDVDVAATETPTEE